ncbi:S-transferase DHAR1 [Seminavis robusta]|uniref:S-transferase DHAR1 n=1 Tax=Seminavis robusta TaxID=568900 RepID=A0A9N8ELC6_9STRA|nr:S-transferase DHAR1 [Seminavis robusta]|eukprot:Sro1389_g268520.1 S-transferase DHAR1 (554) ;mRNA; f:7834-9730
MKLTAIVVQPSALLSCMVFAAAFRRGSAFVSNLAGPISSLTTLGMSSSTAATTEVPTWSDLQAQSKNTVVGQALETETALRQQGKGSAFVQNTLRKFQSPDADPEITVFRDHAGWCPYCQKLMLLIEEKQTPVKIELVPMRSYGDKPRDFLQKVPNGLLPAMEVKGQIITESQVIMELLDKWHPPADGYKPMLPQEEDQPGWARYDKLARLERQLFSWWCTLLFRPEGPGGALQKLMGGGGGMSGSMEGFLDCVRQVDKELTATQGPWFFGDDKFDGPNMIDFIYVSHVERILASCAYWKGLNLRDPKWNLKGLNAWLEAFEKRESYLAFKSDYYTHIKDIPPQYGPGYDGGFEEDRVAFSNTILGKDGAWSLPLSFDDPVQPLYKGPPLPVCVLESVGISPDADGTYESADPKDMAKACRLMAAWKLAGNGENISTFAARGGPKGSQNPRKTFGAELADPYADADSNVRPTVDAALRVVCSALLLSSDDGVPTEEQAQLLRDTVPDSHLVGVLNSFGYLRDRVGVPRDLPLAAARYLRAYLNWGVDVLAPQR